MRSLDHAGAHDYSEMARPRRFGQHLKHDTLSWWLLDDTRASMRHTLRHRD